MKQKKSGFLIFASVILAVLTIFTFSKSILTYAEGQQAPKKKAPKPKTYYAVIKQGEKFGFMDIDGNIVVKPQYDDVRRFSEGLACVKKDYKYGYIDRNGKMAIGLKDYNAAENFSDGYARVETWNYGGLTTPVKFTRSYIDKKGNVKYKIVNNDFPLMAYTNSNSYDFSEGLVYDSEKKCFLDKNFKKKIDFPKNNFKDVFIESEFRDGLCICSKDGDKKYYINKDKKIVINTKDPYARVFKNGYAVVAKELMYIQKETFPKKLAVLNRSGKLITPYKYEEIGDFNQGYAAVKYNGKWGFIGKDGKEVIKTKYQDAKDYSEGLFPVKNNGKWGFVDAKDNKVIDFSYQKVYPFKNGRAFASAGGKYMIIDKKGNVIKTVPCNVMSEFMDIDATYISFYSGHNYE